MSASGGCERPCRPLTIPKDVREQLGLTPGTRVTFIRNVDGEFVLSVTRPSLVSLQGRLKHVGRPVSLDEMDDAIASAATERT